MNDVITVLANLPPTIGGYALRDLNGDYTIVLNARMSRERQLETYRHELKHILHDDFSNTRSADLIEIRAHQKEETYGEEAGSSYY